MTLPTCPWLGIDPLDALEYALDAGLSLHVQAKDIAVDERARTRYGVFGKTVGRTSPTDVGWWRYRVPGRGHLDWNRIIDTLYAAGYDGAVAVEHEDPVWGGTLDKTQQGLQSPRGPYALSSSPTPRRSHERDRKAGSGPDRSPRTDPFAGVPPV